MKVPATTQKLRGGYYTPSAIADFLAHWAIQTPNTTVLEPSCGDGNILESAIAVLIEQGAQAADIGTLVVGVELDEQEAQKATQRCTTLGLMGSSPVHVGDFFAFASDQFLEGRRFGAIIGNPPFIRYQHFLESQRVLAFRLMEQAGLRPTRLTNAWVPFFVASTLLLDENHGRMAMVIPAELLQVNYAAELRRFISDHYNKITLVTFKKLVFSGVQQEVVLLLGERNNTDRTGIRTIELDHIDDLAAYEHTNFGIDDLKAMDHSSEKWTQYFLDQDELDLIRALRTDSRLTLSGKLIDVDVGVVTGLNEFFIMTEQQTRDRELQPYIQPVVARSGHLAGIFFSDNHWEAHSTNQFSTRMLKAPGIPFAELPEALKQYVLKGEEAGAHLGYKCRIRDNWYVVPSVWVPDAFMLRQVHSYPKIILNETGATCTDTIHRVRFRTDRPHEMVTAAFLNSLTFAFSEIVGRSYGGGVLELEPNEAEKLPIPLIGAEALDADELNQLILQGKIDAVLDITDRILLREGLGLSIIDTERLRGIWYKLRDRRINRKQKKVVVAA